MIPYYVLFTVALAVVTEKATRRSEFRVNFAFIAFLLWLLGGFLGIALGY